MTKTKSTKRALLSSALALLLCVSMLIGSTFAWFTDSVTSGSNVITSGKLDVDLVDATGASLEGEMIEWVAKDGRAQDEILWEPGCTYNSEAFYVENKGNLNLKFKVLINGIDGDAELLKVIDFTAVVEDYEVTVQHPWGTYTVTTDIDLINGTTVETGLGDEELALDEFILKPGEKMGPIVLSGHMDEAAGNEYQDLTIEGISVSIVATQAVGEEDSFDGMYDEFADYDGEISNAVSLAAALKNGGTYKVTSDIALDSVATVAEGVTVNLDLGGKTISAANVGAPAIVNNGKLTVSGGKLTNGVSDTKGSHTIQNNAGATLIVEDGEIGDAKNAGAAVYNNGGYVEINGGTFASKQENVKADGKCAYAFINYSGTMIINDATVTEPTHGLFAAYGGTLTVNGGDYTLKDADGTSGLACYMTYTTGEGRVVLNGGNFNVVNTRNGRYMFHYDGTTGKNYFKSDVATGGYVTVNGGTYNFDVTAYAASGYVAIQNGNGTWTVSKKIVLDIDETAKTVKIDSAAEFFLFAKNLNEGTRNFNGYTVSLEADIDLENKAWTPIGQTGAPEFRGTFDGQNHTIKNLYIDNSAYTDEHTSTGLFGWAEAGVTIQNVKVDGASVKGNHNVAVIVGYTYSGKITNCHVSNATVICNHANGDACGDKAGTIAGYTADEARLSDCTASDSTVTAGRDAGQLFGLAYTASVSNCSAANVVVSATGDCDREGNINNAVIGCVQG